MSDRDQALSHAESLVRYVHALLDWLETENPNDKSPVPPEYRPTFDVNTDKSSALLNYEDALSDLRATGDRRGEATALNNIGGVYSALGDKRKALDLFKQAVDLSRQIGDRWLESMGRSRIAMVYEELGKFGEAEHELRIVVALDTVIEHPDLPNARAKLEQVRAQRQRKVPPYQ